MGLFEVSCLIVIIICLLLSGTFSALETALVGTNRIRLSKLAKEGDQRARILHVLLRKPDEIIGIILLGNNVVNILASSLAAYIAISVMGEQGVVFATIIMTFLVLIVSEVTPKSYALFHSENLGLKLARFLVFSRYLLLPFSLVITKLSRAILSRASNVPLELRPSISEDEMRYLLLYGAKGDIFAKEKRLMLLNVLSLAETRVIDLMVPRAKMVCIDIHTSAEDIVKKVKETGFSRFPVYENDVSNVIGVLHVKELLGSAGDVKIPSIKRFIKEVNFVPETKRTDELLKEMRAKKLQMAIIVEEYGTIVGLVTLEDLLEEIVGEIFDEFDKEIERIKRLSDGSMLVDADISIKDLNRFLELDLPEDKSSTLAGFILEELQDMPYEKQCVETKKSSFVVEQVEAQRIVRVKIIPKKTTRFQKP